MNNLYKVAQVQNDGLVGCRVSITITNCLIFSIFGIRIKLVSNFDFSGLSVNDRISIIHNFSPFGVFDISRVIVASNLDR